MRPAAPAMARRMGQRLVALAADQPGLQLVSAFEAAGHPAIYADSGQTAGTRPNNIPISEGPSAKQDVLIDFTTPAVTRKLIELATYESFALVIGTTGLTDDDQKLIDEAARSIPIIQATNFSLVVNVLNVLSARAAQLLGDGYDIEIVEAHHKHKKDAPSGTALTLANVICDATDRDPAKHILTQRSGDYCPRNPKEITVQALRLGDVVGEHTVMFAAPGERMELRHIGTSRDSYASGALRAAEWLAGKTPRRYTMGDVLGLEA